MENIIYNCVYSLYFFLRRIIKIAPSLVKKLAIKVVGYLEAYFNLYVVKKYAEDKNKPFGVMQQKREGKIIVSLTSYPKRINTVWITIETLMRQSIKPDEILLWLAEEQFPSKEKSLPENLLALKKRGLTIRWCDDIRSHKKYFFAMQEYPNDYIILADDDMMYPYDTIETLWNLHKKYPEDICCITAQKMDKSLSAPPSLWENPSIHEKVRASVHAQIFTGSGSLYPPQSLNKEVFNEKSIKELCLHADDLWLTFMALANGTKITASAPWRAFPVEVYGTAESGLWYINGQDGQNDVQWKAILEAYPEEAKLIQQMMDEDASERK